MPDKALTWIDEGEPLPPTNWALGANSEAPGLLAAGAPITPQRLDEAYHRGIFPWYSPTSPPLWWTPDPRMVLPVADFAISHSLRKTLRRFIHTPGCEIRIDTAFREVMLGCAGSPRPGQHGTWIVDEVIDGYCAWHQAGAVHSIETWMHGELTGGLYGVGIGRMFFGESMFSRRSDASKIALAALIAFCRGHGISLIDCQQNTSHLASFGARDISRREFEAHLSRTLGEAPPPTWTYDPRLWALLELGAAPPLTTERVSADRPTPLSAPAESA